MDPVATLQRRERVLALVRVLGVALMAVQVTLYEPPGPELADVAAAVRPFGYLTAAALALVSVAVEVVLRTVRSERGLARWGGIFLVADVAAVMTLVFLYSFDPGSGTWAVIALLPLEGALRFRLTGALAVWAALAMLYPLREAYAAQAFGTPFVVPSIVYRLGLVLVITLFAGIVTRHLDLQLGLLQRLNTATQQLASRLEPTEILQTLCQQAYTCLNARLAVISTLDDTGLHPVASWPPREPEVLQVEGGAEPYDPEVMEGLVFGPLWLEGDGRGGRLLVPLRWQSDPVAHVLVVRPRGRRPGAFEQEVASSLAESAAVALATTRVLQAERRTTERLRYLEVLRTRFVATIAHDLRLPLTVFKGVARMLRSRRDDIDPERINQMLESVERQSNRLARLSDDLLDAARLDADHLVLYPGPCDVEEILRATAADAEEDVLIDVEPGLTLVADAGRLERVVWNLLSNAEKYGKPPIEMTARGDGESVSLSVRDHGDGLQEEQRARLFSDFAGSDDAASVGLGLAIVWQLVSAHGGRVEYGDAEPGARFTVRLPVDGPPARGAPLAAGDEAPAPETGNGFSPTSGSED